MLRAMRCMSGVHPDPVIRSFVGVEVLSLLLPPTPQQGIMLVFTWKKSNDLTK